ncbi:MAG: HAMP domain-containing histidine kinase [Lachnospiraceae bacterium]|nr:HAMP domain-containing histidine kinase [Lachnospiraceae bacterium]
MKQYRTIFLCFLLVMAAAFWGIRLLADRLRFDDRDMVKYNDTVHQIYRDWAAGADERTIEERYGCELILSTSPNDAQLMKFQNERALVVDFAPEGTVLGKLAWSDSHDLYDNSRTEIIKVLRISWAVVLTAGILLLAAIEYFLIRPSRELRKYAGEIAKGNLDVPLPMRRYNPFGSFVEGFDLMREELRNAREREAAAEKAKKELVAELAHDIKTPVATIVATCEVLDAKGRRRLQKGDDADTADMLEKVGTISHKADTIRQLMDNVFQTTLEELSRIEVNPTEENSETIEAYFRNLKNYGKIILTNGIPQCLVYMDRLRMEQVIDNVVGNSAKYANTDICVRFDEVKTESADGAGMTFIRIRVSDSGPGVPEEELPLITEKYYRGTDVKDKAGFGLGLYLVRSYMERQGGGMECYNDDGFTVELYLRKV